LRRMGKVINVRGNNIIVTANFAPKTFSAVYDSTFKLIGWVIDVFGPVNTPYIRVRLVSDISLSDIKGRYLYVDENKRLLER